MANASAYYWNKAALASMMDVETLYEILEIAQRWPNSRKATELVMALQDQYRNVNVRLQEHGEWLLLQVVGGGWQDEAAGAAWATVGYFWLSQE